MTEQMPPAVDDPSMLAGHQVLDTVQQIFTRYTVQSSRHAYVALTLYASYTHAQEVFDYAPRLVLTSPEKQSGKTRTMELVGHLSRAPMFAANVTTAYLYRSLDEPRTVLFDEADTIFGTKTVAEQNEDLRGLLNAGFQRGTPVGRTVGPTHEPMEFHTFAPVVLAAIGRLPDTITDRAVNIHLRRRKPSERVAPFRQSRNLDELHGLRDDLAAWVGAHLDDLKVATPDLPLEDRPADVWEPLIAVADLAGGAWPRLARDAAVALTRDAAAADVDHSAGHELLVDVATVLKDMKADFLPTDALLANLHALPDSRWSDEGLTGRRLSMLLKPYGIYPLRTKTARGYKRVRFEDVIERYLTGAEEDEDAPP